MPRLRPVNYFEDGERMLLAGAHRIRDVRIVRDDTALDRREAPHYHPTVDRAA